MNNTYKRIIFISNSTIPLKDTSGGSVIIYRHLKRMRDAGHKVVVIYLNELTLSGQYNNDFEYIEVKRKWWHPPLRLKTPLLTKVRTTLIFSYLNKKFRFNSNNDLLLGILGEVGNLLLLKIKERFDIPFYLFFHDDFIFNKYASENLLQASDVIKTLNNSDYIFPVSEQLKNLLHEKGVSNTTTLYPIPAGYNGPSGKYHADKHSSLNLLTSGMTGMVHIDILKKIGEASHISGGKFYCVADLPPHMQEDLTAHNFITYKHRFETTDQLFDFITKCIDILVVFYSFDAGREPRLLTSFPSKFVEYSHLGLPILLVAPSYSSLGKWAVANEWISYADNDTPDAIAQQIEKFKDAGYWEACRIQSLKFAQGDFNPGCIHDQFVSHLQL